MNRIIRKALGPVVVVAALGAAGAGVFLLTPRGKAQTDGPARARRIPVVTTAARKMTFEARLALSGNVEAETYALVSARIPGTLEEIYADEGDRVEADKTQLFRTDSLKLTQAVEVARQQLAVAASSVRERQAGLEELKADHDQDGLDLKRYRQLHERGVATDHELEVQQSRHKQSAARVKHAQALLDLARAQLEQAGSSLSMAQKDLADSRVVAPINGRVCQRFREPGEMAAAGTPVLKIEDRSVLEISAFLPEDYYPRVEIGKTPMRVRVADRDLGEHPVTYKSPTIRTTLRTFEVKCRIADAPEAVVPGALAEVVLVLDRRDALGVPAAAVEIRGGGPVVFVLDGQGARKVPIQSGLETDGWLEVREGELSAGAAVVTMGQNFLEDGAAVRRVEEAE